MNTPLFFKVKLKECPTALKVSVSNYKPITLQEKNIEITQDGQGIVTTDKDFDGLSKIIINVNTGNLASNICYVKQTQNGKYGELEISTTDNGGEYCVGVQIPTQNNNCEMILVDKGE